MVRTALRRRVSSIFLDFGYLKRLFDLVVKLGDDGAWRLGGCSDAAQNSTRLRDNLPRRRSERLAAVSHASGADGQHRDLAGIDQRHRRRSGDAIEVDRPAITSVTPSAPRNGIWRHRYERRQAGARRPYARRAHSGRCKRQGAGLCLGAAIRSASVLKLCFGAATTTVGWIPIRLTG